ncbi:MAG: hypothetical protein JO267_12245 [Alphaproteobacteria bacterium]|nr:hypothetical protein [Alphaproteobacteria bacterium]
MKNIWGTLSAVAMAGLMQTSLVGLAIAQTDQGGAQSAGENQPASMGYVPQGGDQGAAGPSGATRPLDMPVLYVTGIEIVRTGIDPKLDLIRVTGLTGSQGWSNPQLVPFFYGKPADDVLDLQFIATSPQQSQRAEGFVPISAMFTLDAGHPFKGVRVRAGANAIELKQIPGTAQAQIKTTDCKECVGKKFAEKGQGAPGQPGVIRAEDLPRGYRVIAPSHGVAGIVHNPNRLNLVLGDDNTIVMAFWE